MILYLDTSALVKLYVKEPGSKAVRALLERARVVSTLRVVYVEMRPAWPESSVKANLGKRNTGTSYRFLRRIGSIIS